MSKVSPEKLLLVGKVIRPHGVKGLVRVWSYARSAESFLHSESVFFELDQQAPVECRVLEVRPYKNIFLMTVEGLNSYENADKFRGAKIFVRKDHLKQNNDNEYYWFELIGLDIYRDDGEYLGILKEIIPTGSNDVYVVKGNKSEYLIPATHEVIRKIDTRNNKMIISVLEGLLELNEG